MSLILIVEDEKELIKVLQAYLTRAGYRALGAYSGDEGMRLYEQEKPDLVLLDLNLPGRDGLELAREMRKSRDVPIIMATARVDEIDRLIGLELGADDYITSHSTPAKWLRGSSRCYAGCGLISHRMLCRMYSSVAN